MTESAIRAEGLRKTYRVHRKRATSIKELALSGLFDRGEVESFDALKDVSFELPRGRSLAVVGPNGSGKSTLLKLMAGIMEPDAGAIRVSGRVAALLELGAGFQLEFTGMENIFLQGALIGLTREEILSKLDDIIAFSELERFIHTPMKRYSSGMVVRLGFAGAIHADPEVLLVDEVLAVGDAAFQKKCLRAIDQFRENGGTVVLVSHAPRHIERVGEDMLWLDKGEVRLRGSVTDALPEFLNEQRDAAQRGQKTAALPKGDRRRATAMVSAMTGGEAEHLDARIIATRVRDANGRERAVFAPDEPLSIEVEYEILKELEGLEVQLGWMGFVDTRMGFQSTVLQSLQLSGTPGVYRALASFDALPWADGRYALTTALANPKAEHEFHDVHVMSTNVFIRGGRPSASDAVLNPPGHFADAPA